MGVYDAWAWFWLKATPGGMASTTFWPPKNDNYDPAKDVPDLSGKVILVTGGASGIGYTATKELLLKNAKVYIAGRNRIKVADAVAALAKETGRTAIPLHLDLEDLDSVKAAAVEFLGLEERLDILFCNAGVMGPPDHLLTKQGYDLQFGTNVIGHYLFSVLLLPALRRSTSATGTKARINHTSSAGHTLAPAHGLAWDSFTASPARDALLSKWGKLSATWLLYGQSKMGNILIANLLDRAYGSEVVSFSSHPGFIDTELHRHEAGWQRFFGRMVHWPAAMGAWTMLWGATSEEGEGFGGKYLIPWCRVGKADKRAANEALQDELKVWLDKELAPWLD